MNDESLVVHRSSFIVHRWASEVLPREQAEIAGVARAADLSPQNGPFDGAVLLVRVGAIGEAAQGHEWPKLREEALHFLRQQVPQLKLANARRIDHPAAEVQLDQLRRRGRVPALLCRFTDLADTQPQVRLHRIEQRRFANTALAGEDRL